MIGFPPTSARDAATSLAARLCISALVPFLIRDWFTSSGPGIPQSEAYCASAIALASFVWCASGCFRLIRWLLWPPREPEEPDA